jgi:hypothetical protein
VDLVDGSGVFTSVAVKSLVVQNVAPTLSVAGADRVAEGISYELSLGDVADPGRDDGTTFVIHWGDGESSVVSSEDLPADRVVRHVYADGTEGGTTHIVSVDLAGATSLIDLDLALPSE